VNRWELDIPFTSFGAVTSDDLFAEKEQELFRFYAEAGKVGRYRKVLDIGANIGVHTILMARQGWHVSAIEPDPDHYNLCVGNVSRNLGGLRNVVVTLAAVSDHAGRETFVRVKGNTTGSHLKGDKQPYGDLEEFTVQVVDCRKLFYKYDFAKIDCEGHEARLLCTVPNSLKTEFMVEVGSFANADAIFNHFRMMSTYRMWTQQSSWCEVADLSDMPMHHSHGALFIGKNPPFDMNFSEA